MWRSTISYEDEEFSESFAKIDFPNCFLTFSLKMYAYARFYSPLDKTLKEAKTTNIVSGTANDQAGIMERVNWTKVFPQKSSR